ncbi:MAG: hypothetical protein QOG64_1219 [Acidimicrobiaceae bacterium]|nr:hypothetical protein [Acidimicrobiaceae bacterium]
MARDAARARAAQARAAAGQAGLSAVVQDFVALAAGASGEEFTVTYDLGDQRGTVAQRPPDHRLDIVDPDGTDQAFIVNAKGSFACRRPGPAAPAPAAWSCESDSRAAPPLGTFSLDDLTATVNALVASRAAFDTRVESRPVAGTVARCLVTSAKPGAAVEGDTLCISAQGVPLLVEGGTNPQLHATGYSRSVRGDPFRLPAPARSG